MVLIWFRHSWGGFFSHLGISLFFWDWTQPQLVGHGGVGGEWGAEEGGGGGSKSFSIPLLVDKCMSLELVLDLALLTFDQIPDCTPEDSFVEEKLLAYEN